MGWCVRDGYTILFLFCIVKLLINDIYVVPLPQIIKKCDTTMKTTFNYDEVPFTFGHCAVTTCPKRETCLRYIAWQHAPITKPFISLMNVRYLEGRGNRCDKYLSNEPIRYAKGFVKTLEQLPVKVFRAFHDRMLGQMGYRNFYLNRKGERLMSPEEQSHFIQTVESYGIKLEEYFDDFVEGYKWG